MRVQATLTLLFLLLVPAGCAERSVDRSAPVVSRDGSAVYLKEIKPILDARCVVCHSCYTSPCQLKLSSYECLDRGAT
jgi:hypothetical protein